MDKIKYIIGYGGGLGPDVWDNELIIEAANIYSALKKAKIKLDVESGKNAYDIYAIMQED